jgi:hypothetical protein
VLSQITAIQPVGATLFPFLTAEWKSGGGSEGHAQAALQAARGAACLVNYNYALLEYSGKDPSSSDTIHFTITCDMQTVKLYVHWRDYVGPRVQHFSKKISVHKLRDDDGDENNPHMRRFRGRLRNVLDWAIGDRLKNIHEAIASIAKKEDG